MTAIVLRIRLISGEMLDVKYDHSASAAEGEVVDHVVATLRDPSGVLRCSHGERLLAIYSRGVSAVEFSPRGAVL
ncbi:MAG TPA: hypothetical protein VLB29_11895 [Nocardioidaceae bacterium]|nr:hypothetical protein [Nocardioidaceae bacterium]